MINARDNGTHAVDVAVLDGTVGPNANHRLEFAIPLARIGAIGTYAVVQQPSVHFFERDLVACAFRGPQIGLRGFLEKLG